MLVLADIEWAYPQEGKPYPTQLALQRVDDKWNTAAVFYSRIRPAALPHDWSFCAFAGGTAEEFLTAPCGPEVEEQVRAWLQEEDLLCWWFEQSQRFFRRFFPALKHRASAAVTPDLPAQFQNCAWKERNPYRLVKELLHAPSSGTPCGVDGALTAVPGPEHHALNDTHTMRLALSMMQFQQSWLFDPPAAAERSKQQPAKEAETSAKVQFLYNAVTNTIHHKDCSLIGEEVGLVPFETLKIPLHKGYKPCPQCCAKLYREALTKRNAGILSRCQYTYIFSPASKVFHKYNCKMMLSAHTIHGTGKYDACLKKGLRPCKRCNPTKEDPLNPTAAAAVPQSSHPKAGQITLSKERKRAVSRLRQAQQERFDPNNEKKRCSAFRDDFYTLTQPRFVFWAARGYQSFHTRNCPKLKGLSSLVGFSRCSEAVRAGYTPCKHCKPSKKQDAVYSIPIKSRKRAGESYHRLVDLCKRYHYPCTLGNDKTCFLMETPVGKWRIHLSANPIALEHINLTSPKGSKTQYHQQPRLFLSLTDTFFYIHRHDSDLLRRVGMKNNRAASKKNAVSTERMQQPPDSTDGDASEKEGI